MDEEQYNIELNDLIIKIKNEPNLDICRELLNEYLDDVVYNCQDFHCI